MKYQLIISGTKAEIEKARFRWYEVNEYSHYSCTLPNLDRSIQLGQGELEFKVVEPFRYETTSLLSEDGLPYYGLSQADLERLAQHKGKKVKIVIEEVE